jgi:putative membrane protein
MQFRMFAVGLLGSMAMLATGGVGVAAAQSASTHPGSDSSQLSRQDHKFIIQNAQSNLAEIITGKLAAQRGTTEEVRQVARMLVSDHQQALSKLEDVAHSVNVTLPTSPNPMQQRMAQEERNASDADFDQLYIRHQIMGHQLSIAQTRQEIQSGSNQQVVEFAKFYLPIAEKHLQLLQQLCDSNTSHNKSQH